MSEPTSAIEKTRKKTIVNSWAKKIPSAISFEYIFGVSHLFKQYTFLFFGFHYFFRFFFACIQLFFIIAYIKREKNGIAPVHSIFSIERGFVFYKYVCFRTSNLFIFGLSLLNVRTRNNVHFLLYPCNFLHCGEFFFIYSLNSFVVFFSASQIQAIKICVLLYALQIASIHAENHHMKNRKSIYFGIVI